MLHPRPKPGLLVHNVLVDHPTIFLHLSIDAFYHLGNKGVRLRVELIYLVSKSLLTSVFFLLLLLLDLNEIECLWIG
jgi:hypothetical protein